MSADRLYGEIHRPQFHFSPRKNWTNDPNGLVFNQQMSFPVELTLRSFPEGIRLCREPVREIQLLNDTLHAWKEETVTPGRNLVPPTQHDLFRIRGEIDVGSATAFGLILRGNPLRYDAAKHAFTFLGREVPCEGAKDRLSFEILLDRTSMELFVQGGRTSASFCHLPEAWDAPIEIFAEGASVAFRSLSARELSSAWL